MAVPAPLALGAALAVAALASFLLLAQLAGWRSGTDDLAQPGFLATALGAPQSAAPLVREPAPGLRVEISPQRFRVADRGAAVGLALAGTSGTWRAYERGAARATSFGSETITLEGATTEQFLTVARRQGPRTWRWRLDGGLNPRVTPQGWVGFFDGPKLAPLAIAPAEIFDDAGRTITPAGTRWTVTKRGAKHWLELRLDDRKLPLPYVIDPIVLRTAGGTATSAGSTITLTIPATAVENDLLLLQVGVRNATPPTTPGGWNLVGGTNTGNSTVSQAVFWRKATASDAGTSVNVTIPAAAAAGYVNVYRGVDTTAPIQQTTTTTASNSRNVNCPTMTTNIANEMVVCHGAIANDATWPGSANSFTLRNSRNNGTSVDIAAYDRDVATSGTLLGATTFANVVGSNARSVGNTTGLRPDGDSPTHGTISVSGVSPSGIAYASGGTIYYRGSAAGSFQIVDPATDTQSAVESVNYPSVASVGWTHAHETVGTSPNFTSSAYSWTAGTTTPPTAAERTLTATDRFGNTATLVVPVVNDSTAPAGGALTVNGGAGYDADGSFPIDTRTDYTDPGSGLASSTLVRESATLTGDACGTFGSPTTLVGTPAQSGLATGCYRYTLTGTDNVGNTASVAVTVKVDTTAPVTAATPVEGANPAAQHYNASDDVFFFRAGAAGDFTLGATATEADTATVDVAFPDLSGFGDWTGTGGADTTTPYGSTTYSFGAAAVSPDAVSVTSTNAAGGSGTDAISIKADSAAPAGGVLSVNGGAGYDTDGSFAIDLRTDYAEAASATASGLASSELVRETASLTADACGAFGSATTLAGAPAQSGLATGCYRYTLTGTDNVGTAASVSTTVKVDTTAPSAPVLTPSATSGGAYYSGSGTTIWFRPGAATGQFDLAANSTDGDTGVPGYTFPTAAAMGASWSVAGSGASRTYSYTAGAAEPGVKSVDAANAAGSSSSSTFTVSADTTAPGGGALTVNGGAAYDTDGSFPIDTRTDYTDGGSGLVSSTLVRESATLTNDSCGAFGSPTSLVGTPAQSGLADGCYRYTLTGTDNVGNTATVTTTVKVDSAAPASAADVLAAYQAANGVSVTYSSSDGTSGIEEVELWVDGPGAGTYTLAATDTTPASPSFSFTAAEGDGLYRFYTRARDTAGNSESAPGSADAITTVDTGKPSSAADALAAFVSGAGFTVTYTRADAVSGVDEVELWVDGPNAGSYVLFATDADPSTPSFAFTAAEGEGLYSFYTRARDDAGNVEDAPGSADTSTTLETTPPSAPALSFGSFTNASATGTTVYVREGAVGGFTITSDSDDPQSGIDHHTFPSFWGEGGSVAGDPAAAAYTFGGSDTAPDGAQTVTATNGVGAANSGASTFAVVADTTAPATSILCDGASCGPWKTTSPVTVTLAASDGGSGVDEIRYTTDGSDPTSGNGTVYAGGFAVAATTTVKYRAYDAVGNEEAVGSQLVRIDTTPPAATMTDPGTNLSGTVNLASVTSDGGSGVASVVYERSPADAGSWTATPAAWNTTLVADGLYDLRVTATDAAGNSTTSTVVEDRRVDNLFPETTIDAQPGNPSNDATPSFQFSSTEPGSTFQCRLDSGAWSACTSPHTTATLGDRDHTFEVRATDPAGNPDATPASHTWLLDTVAPADGSITVTAGYDTDGSVAIATDNGTDSGSGVDAASATFERESATLAAAACGAFSGSWTTVGAPDASVANGNCYRYRLRVRDNAGNWTTYGSASEVKVDLTDPSAPTLMLGALTNAVLSGGAIYFRPGTAGSFDVTPSSSDAESGIAGYGHPSLGSGWSRSGDTWSFTAAAADPSEPSNVTATSGSGRTSPPTSFTVTADSTGPTTGAQCDGAACSAGWYTSSPVSVTLSAADAGAGVKEIRYTTDGSDPTVTSPLYAGALSVTPGTTTIKFRAEDKLGNVEPVGTLVVRVDITAPTTPSLSVSALTNASENGGIVFFRPGATGGFTVSSSSSDPESGIASTAFPALGSGWSESGGVYSFSPSAGDPAEPLDVTATNGAGLVSAGTGLTVTADAVAPATTVACTGGCVPWHTASPVTVTLSATDALSGVDEIRYSTDGSAPETVYGGPFALSAEGTTTLRFAATDEVGNAETAQSQPVRIDTVAPAASITDPGVYARGDVTLVSTQSDATSGVDTVQFRYRPTAGAWTNTPATWDTDGLANGDYELQVVVTDAAGNSTTSSPAAVTVDNLAPSITLDAPASPASGLVTLTSSASDAHSGVAAVEYEFLHPVDGWTATTSAWDTTDGPDGVYDLRARATDGAGNVSGWSVVSSIQVDNTPPAVVLTTPADGSYVNAAAADPYSLIATADDAGGTGVQKVDFFQWSGGAWSLVDTDATSPYAASWPLPADRSQRLLARATDLAGHTSESEVTVTVDRTAPTAGITDPGAYLRLTPPLVGSATDATSGVGSVAFQRSPAGADSWTTIAVDAAAPYTAPFDTTTAATPDGLYDLRVFVTDLAGNSTTAVVSSRRIDNTAPTGTLTDPGPYLRGTVGLSGSAADGGSGVASVAFRRSAEGAGDWTTIATDTDGGDGWSASLDTSAGGTPDGVYDVQLVVTDRAGNSYENVVASRRIDNTKPTAAITNPGANLRGSITLAGDATDVGGSGVATVLFERSPAGGGSWTAISTDADESNGWSAGLATSSLADGLYDFRITATDRAGNEETSVVANRRIDNTDPSGALGALPPYLRSTVAFDATATDTGSGVAAVEFQRSPAGSGGPWTQIGTIDNDGGNGWSTAWPSGPDGTYDFRVRVEDFAGNVAGSAVVTRMVDNTAPETNDDAPASSASPVTVTLTASDAGSGPSATQFRLDGGSWQSGTTVSIPAPADNSNDGIHTLEYYSTDAAGNVEATESVEILIDTTGPGGTVDDPANYLRGLVTLTADPADPADVSKVRFEFAPAGTGAWASIGPDVLSAPFEATWDTTAVTDGAYDLQVTMFDALGNATVTSLPGKTVDNGAPSATITAPASGAVKGGNVAITATANDANAGVERVTFRAKPSGASGFSDIGVDSSPGPGGTYAISWPTAGLPDGLADIQVVARDWAGNEMGDTLTVILDNNAPTVAVNVPGGAVSGDVTLTATASADVLDVEFRVDGAAIGTDSDGSNGWSITWSTSGDGSRSITARATDVGGNEGTSPAVNVQVDNTDPTGAVTAPSDGATVGGPSVALASNAADSGSGVASVTYQYKATADPSFVDIATGTTWDTTPLATGPYQLRARILDNAGNVSTSAAITVQVDSTAPTVALANPGASLSGAVTLTATVSGLDAQRVVFERSPAGGGTWTEIATDTTSPWSAAFATQSVADGLYDLRASVFDSYGNTNSSTRSGIRIDNTAPRVASTSPSDGATVSSASSLDVTASEMLAAVNDLKLDGVSIGVTPSGASFSIAGPFADGPHVLSGELEDVAGKTARFRVNFTVLAGAPTAMPYVEKNTSAAASTSLTSPDGSARVVVPAGAWSNVSDWLVIRIQPLPGTTGASSVVDVTARWAIAGTEVKSFAAPIEIVLLNTTGNGVVPATLEGTTWRVLRPVPSAGALPGDWEDGFWRDSDGVHVLTRHLSVFGLVADVVPPSPPRAAGVVDAEGLKLRWTPGSDDSGQLGQVKLYVNGAPYADYELGQTEAKLGAWTAADTRSFTFTQLDLAGNESVHTKRLVGVPGVAGLHLTAAGRALTDRGFAVGRVTQRASSAAAGTVLEPAGLTIAEEGTEIDLVVAAGANLPAPQAKLVFTVVGTPKLDPRKRGFVAARIKVSRASRVTATLISPQGERLYTWRLRAKAGATINVLRLPRQIRRPGVYRIVFTAAAGEQTVRRTIRVRLVGKAAKQLRPAGSRPVEIVVAGESASDKAIALGLDGSRTRVVRTSTDGTYRVTGSAGRDVRVVVVDVDHHGVGLVRDLHMVFPDVKLLALASRPQDRTRALKAGAAAVLPRNSPPERIGGVLRRLSAAR